MSLPDDVSGDWLIEQFELEAPALDALHLTVTRETTPYTEPACEADSTSHNLARTYDSEWFRALLAREDAP